MIKATSALSTRQLLQWHLDAGVDETIGNQPVDRYAAAAQDKAAKAAPPPPAPQGVPQGAPKPAAQAAEQVLLGACELAERAQTVEELRAALETFDGCALRKTATNLVFGDGDAQAKIIFIGEAPGEEEDRQGVPFVGPSGKLLDKMLGSIGLDRGKVFISNTVFWRPPGNRSPTTSEMAVCMPFVERLVELVDPEILVALGGPAAKSMLAQTSGISRLRGRWFSYSTPRLPRPVQATAVFHPAYLLRTPAQKRTAWNDLLAIRKKLDSV